jgi:hypothetical protein
VQKFLRFLNLNIDKMEYGVGVTSDLTQLYNLFFTKVEAAFTIDCRPNATAGATIAAPASPLYMSIYVRHTSHSPLKQLPLGLS